MGKNLGKKVFPKMFLEGFIGGKDAEGKGLVGAIALALVGEKQDSKTGEWVPEHPIQESLDLKHLAGISAVTQGKAYWAQSYSDDPRVRILRASEVYQKLESPWNLE